MKIILQQFIIFTHLRTGVTGSEVAQWKSIQFRGLKPVVSLSKILNYPKY